MANMPDKSDQISNPNSKEWIPVLNELFDKYARIIRGPKKYIDEWRFYGRPNHCPLCSLTCRACGLCPLSNGHSYNYCFDGTTILNRTAQGVVNSLRNKSPHIVNVVKARLAARKRRSTLKKHLQSRGWKFRSNSFKVIAAPEVKE